MFRKLGTYVPGTSTSILHHNGYLVCFCSGKFLASEASAKSTGRPTECVPLSKGFLRHAASDSTAVKPSLLMARRGGSPVDIVVLAPSMSSAVVGCVLGNFNVEGRRN